MFAAISLKETRHRAILTLLSVVLAFVFLLTLGVGQVTIPLKDILVIFLSKTGFASYASDTVYETVLLNIRLPRLIMTVLIGAALAVGGASLQGLFRNPLVEPGLIGVSSGAALGVVTFIVFGAAIVGAEMGMNMLTPLFAFGGGLLAAFLVKKIGGQVGQTNIAVLILAGVAINAFCGALMGLVIYHADENQLRMFTFWTLGDLGGASWHKLIFAAPLLIFSTIRLTSYANALNAIALGEAEAFHMGVDVEKVKRSIILFSALAIGISVSLAGIIGFVGLVIPHLIRVAFQSDNRLVLPASLMGGPLLLILADLAARTLVSPAELPIGIVTAFLGAPFFIFLLVRARTKKDIIIQ